MMDQRKMLCTSVCLTKLSPKELPRNALKQYHSYVKKRKSSMTTTDRTKSSLEISIPSQSPFSEEHSHVHTTAASVNANNNTNGADMSDKHVPTNDATVTCTITQSPPLDLPCLPEVSGHNLKPVISKSSVTDRRNSVASSSSSHSSRLSPGKKLTASVFLSPITWDKSGYTSRQLECSETMSGLPDDSPSSESESANNFAPFLKNNMVSEFL